jgi:hypothetical protein
MQREFVREDVGVCRGDRLLYSPAMSKLRRQSSGPLQGIVKGTVNPCLHAFPTPRTMCVTP